MKVLMVGATGATGKLVVADLRSQGHEVTALVRRAGAVPGVSEVVGDVLDAQAVDRAVRGQEAVVVVLGIRENPLWVRLRGASGTSTQVRSEGTRNIVQAMKKHGLRRLIVQSSYGVGVTRDKLSLAWSLIFSLVLKPQIADTEIQEQIVRASGLDWVLAQPVGLNDGDPEDILASDTGQARSMGIARASVAKFLAEQVVSDDFVRRCVALSA